MNQSTQQLAHLMNNYNSTNEQQVLQQYLASAGSFSFSHAHNLALHGMATMNGSSTTTNNLLNHLNNFTAFGSLAAAMAVHQSNLTSSPLSSTNSSTSNSLSQSAPMFALLQAQQRLNGLNSLTNGLNASSLLQKYDQANINSQQSPSSASNCSSPPTCSSVTPPTPPPLPTSCAQQQTSLQLLAQHYQNLQQSTTNSSSLNNTISTLSNSLSNGHSLTTQTNSNNVSNLNNIPSSLSAVAAAAVLNNQPNLNSLVALNNNQLETPITSKRLTTSPDTDASNAELIDIQQQYYNQLNSLRQQLLLSSTGLASFDTSSLTKQQQQQANQPMKDLARLYSAINCNNIVELNSPINSSLSSSSSSTNSLQNTMTSLQQQHSQMMAAMASTGTFAHNAHMHLLSPNSIKSLKFSIENILSPSFGNSPAEIAAAINHQQQQHHNNQTTKSLLTNSSPMSKLLEFNKHKNGLNSNNSSSSKKLSNFLNSNSNNITTKQQISNKLEQINSNINGLSSIINNLNPGLSALDFKLNTSKRKKRSSSSLDDNYDKDFESIRNVKRKNSIDSDCSNSNSSGQTRLLSNCNNNLITSDSKQLNLDKSSIDCKSNDSIKNKIKQNKQDKDKDSDAGLPTPEEVLAGKQPVPAWVFCTRYSDRPSSGMFSFLFWFVSIFQNILYFFLVL